MVCWTIITTSHTLRQGEARLNLTILQCNINILPFIAKVIYRSYLIQSYLSYSTPFVKEQKNLDLEEKMMMRESTIQVSQTKKYQTRLSDLLKVLTFGPPPNRRLPEHVPLIC